MECFFKIGWWIFWFCIYADNFTAMSTDSVSRIEKLAQSYIYVCETPKNVLLP